jgi:MFS family permease
VGYSAGLLWTVSNFIAFGYAPEHEKGTFFMIQNCLGAFGLLVAASVVMGISFNDPTIHVTPESVYAVFLSLMMLGVVLAWFICKPEDVRHEDKPIAIFRHESWWNETKGIAMLFKDVRTWLVVPLLFACEIPVTLQPTISGTLSAH